MLRSFLSSRSQGNRTFQQQRQQQYYWLKRKKIRTLDEKRTVILCGDLIVAHKEIGRTFVLHIRHAFQCISLPYCAK